MSKRRKKTRGNPAKDEQLRRQAVTTSREFLDFMRDSAEDGIDGAREALLEAGATDEQIDRLMRVHRCRIAYEALEIGDIDTFERVLAPVTNELEVRALIDKANDLGMNEYLGDDDEH